MTHDEREASAEAPLTPAELVALIERVFAPAADERTVVLLVDLPDENIADTPPWQARRELGLGWARALADEPRFDPELWLYRNVRMNNAELPPHCWAHPLDRPLVDSVAALDTARSVPFSELFARRPLILAPTQFSATAPLKLAAKAHGFRAATMGGLSPAMVPALRLDYCEVDRRVRALAGWLSEAQRADLRFAIDDPAADGKAALELSLDLRHRSAHASGGLLREPGTAGNLPSGESYIVPYEGELPADPSRSCGVLPLQRADEIVRYRVEQNRVCAIEGEGPRADAERARLSAEPAYGNIAELGLGVLADFGVRPVGVTLLDEKLGLHVAFGRSDHFGGQVGPGDFSRPEAVVHIDHVYIPEIQPRVRVEEVLLHGVHPAARGPLELMRDGRYAVEF